MKKSKLTLILALVIIVALIVPFTTYATETSSEETLTTDNAVVTSLDENTVISDPQTEEGDVATVDDGENAITTQGDEETLEQVNGNYYEYNTNIVLNKAIDGNAFLAGDNIKIEGQINGDLFVMAKNVELTINSKIYGNVFVICDTLTHAGLVYNLYAVTTNYTCEYDGVTALDLKVFAENIKFSGYTERSAYFVADKIELADDAYILGNLMYSSENDPTIAEKATIYGETTSKDFSSLILDKTSTNIAINYLISAISLLGFVLISLLLISFFKPNILTKEIKFNLVTCLKALGIGLLTVVILPILMILLFISTIFAKFTFVLLTLFVLALMIGALIIILLSSIMLYNIFSKGKSKAYIILYTILTALIYFGLTIIPFAGIFINMLISLTGFGFIICWLFSIRKSNMPVKVKTEKIKKLNASNKKDKDNKKSKKDKDNKELKKDEESDKDNKELKKEEQSIDTNNDSNSIKTEE